MIKRKKTKPVFVGKVKIGGGAPVSIQSMTNTDTRDVSATLKQINDLSHGGCDIVRVAIPDKYAAASALSSIISQSPIPVIADIHFDYKLALDAIKNGAHGIRINPGNIGGKNAVAKIAKSAGEAGIPIRVGANSGSLSAKFAAKIKKKGIMSDEAMADALVESAIEQCEMLEKLSFFSIKVSLKAPSVLAAVLAYRKFSEIKNYPLHLGITEAGTFEKGIVKSAVGIGTLLLEGIGDTIRVSLTGDPLKEIKAAIMILEAAGLRKACPEIISCPTCGRTELDVEKLAIRVEKEIEMLAARGKKMKPVKIAIMGCAVNGPGEAKFADIGISGGKNGKIIIFRKGAVSGAYDTEEGIKIFISEIKKEWTL